MSGSTRLRSASFHHSSWSSLTLSGCWAATSWACVKSVVRSYSSQPTSRSASHVRVRAEALERRGREVPGQAVGSRRRPPAVLVHRRGWRTSRSTAWCVAPGRSGRRRSRGSSCRPSAPGRSRRPSRVPGCRPPPGSVGPTSMTCVNWVAGRAVGLDPLRPCHDHRVAGAAEVAGGLLAPLEGGVEGVRPGRGDVRRGVVAAERLEAAVLLDEPELLLRLENESVEEGELVERARDRALEAGAVVTPDVDDERVVEVAHLVDRVEEPADVPVGVLLVAGVDLGLARVELLLDVVVERVPGREGVWPLGQLGVCRDDAELLLAGEGPLAQLVPAVVERALVRVGPLLRDVVRGMGAAGRVEHEPRLGRVLRPDRGAATRSTCP